MRRFLLVLAATAAALVVVLPATAGAATFRGVVIAKDSARKAIVTASANGTVRTVRLHAGFKRLRVGGVVVVRGSKLPDGTFSAGAVKRTGKARQAHVRGTVVKRIGARLVISAGGSVFALRLRGKAGASARGGGLEPGDRVEGKTEVRNGGLSCNEHDLQTVGHEGRLVLEGIYLDTAEDGTLELAVVHRGRVFVKVPAGMEVPAFEAGDEIALVVTVESDGSFTLVKGENENEAGEGVEIGKEQFSVAGILAAVGRAGVAVKVEGRNEPVRCTVPVSYDLTGFEVGQRVYMTCKYREAHFVLVELKKKESAPPPSGEYVSAEGMISELDSSHVTLEVENHAPLTCGVPAGMNLLGFTVGDEAKMYCKKVDGAWMVKALLNGHASVSPEGSWFMVEGTISELNSLRIGLDVEGRVSPVTCNVTAGADLTGFAVGDQVAMKCKLMDGSFRLKLLESETAHYELT